MTLAAVSTPALLTWVALALLAGVVLGATAATALARRHGGGADDAAGTAAPAPVAPGGRPAAEHDDLPGFLEHPPGSPGPRPAPAVPVGSAAPGGRRPGAGRHSPRPLSAQRTVLAMVVAAVVLVLVATLVALLSGDEPAPRRPAAAAPSWAPPSTPSSALPSTPSSALPSTLPSTPSSTPSSPPVPTPVPAGGLATRSVTPGAAGVAARAAFGTVLLERRPAGVTVTRPGLSVTSDGRQALAHVLLPTYNCLAPEPPADPEAAGCARGATEHAELAGPGLRLTRTAEGLEVAGRIATYTRPPTGPAAYTGRSYRFSASLTAEGPGRGGVVPAHGLLRLGPAVAATTGDAGATVLELPR